MYIKKELKLSQKDNKNIEKDIISLIQKADKIVIGAGAGLSAAAGLNYNDEILFNKLYGPFVKLGHQTIAQTLANYWYLTEENAKSYWGFWSHHIHNIYYHYDQLDTYKMLYDIIKEKDYFVITTNVDDQFKKGGFDHKKVYSMQGSYGQFQCQKACHNKIYDNNEMIQQMLLGFDHKTLEIKDKDIPRCPNCGGLMCPNLRVDHLFVNGDTTNQRSDYINFIDDAKDKIVFLELGVGYNTPIIIRYPFEEMTKLLDHGTLIRVNYDYDQVPEGIVGKSVTTNKDIHMLLNNIIKKG